MSLDAVKDLLETIKTKDQQIHQLQSAVSQLLNGFDYVKVREDWYVKKSDDGYIDISKEDYDNEA